MDIKYIILGILLSGAIGSSTLAQDPDTLAPQVFATTGGFFTSPSDSLTLSFTMGEMMTRTAVTQNGTLILTQGFQQPERFELVGIFVPPELTVEYRAYPIPTASTLTLELDGKEPTTLFAAVYDMRGRMTTVPEQRLGFVGQFRTLFDLSELTEGNYFLRIYDENRNLIETLKIQKVSR